MMRGAVLLAVAVLVPAAVALAIAPRPAPAEAPPAETPQGCGLPANGPLWIDYAGHDAPIVPKPGLILAVSSSTEIPAELRQAGAATIFFDLHLNDRVGTTSAPADPATIAAKAPERVRVRAASDRVRDAADRRERALRRPDADAMERHERSVPRECPRSAARTRRSGLDDRAHDRKPALHRR
jgi:hypothetical protein